MAEKCFLTIKDTSIVATTTNLCINQNIASQNDQQQLVDVTPDYHKPQSMSNDMEFNTGNLTCSGTSTLNSDSSKKTTLSVESTTPPPSSTPLTSEVISIFKNATPNTGVFVSSSIITNSTTISSDRIFTLSKKSEFIGQRENDRNREDNIPMQQCTQFKTDNEKVKITLLETLTVDNVDDKEISTIQNKNVIEKATNIKPKRLSDEFFSADDGEYDIDEFKSLVTVVASDDSDVVNRTIKSIPNIERKKNAYVQIADLPKFEENSNDHYILNSSVYMEDEISFCSNLIDINNTQHDDSSPHSSASPTLNDNNNEDEENGANHYIEPDNEDHDKTVRKREEKICNSNDVQSMDAIERKHLEMEQQSTGGLLFRHCSLISNNLGDDGDNRLNLALLNKFSNETSEKSPKNKIDNKCNSTSSSDIGNTVATTPTSSRTKIIRFGLPTKKSTATKVNLSESLEKLTSTTLSILSEEINSVHSTIKLSNHSKLGESSKFSTSSPSMSSLTAVDVDTGSCASISSEMKLKLLQKSSFDEFLNCNSNDSFSTSSGLSNLSLNKVVDQMEVGQMSEISSQSNVKIIKIENDRDDENDDDIKDYDKKLAMPSTSSKSNTCISTKCEFADRSSYQNHSKECCTLVFIMPVIKQEIVVEDKVTVDESKTRSKKNFDNNEISKSSTFSKSSASVAAAVESQTYTAKDVNENMDEANYNQSHVLIALENNDYEEDTWADCQEISAGEEVCTCRDYTDECGNFGGGSSEDELPSRDVDLSCYDQLDTISEDILNENGRDPSQTISRNYRKRKLTETKTYYGSSSDSICGDQTAGNRKRLALSDRVTSPKLPISPSTSSLNNSQNSNFCLSLSEKQRTPRSLIPTRENPPPELHDWLIQFQRWSHVERLVAIDRLIERCEPTQVRHMMKVIEPQFQRDFISLLPKELALQVLSFLEPKDLLRAAQTCRSWRFLCDDNLLWKEKCKQSAIVIEPSTDRPKRGRAGNMPPISSPWKAAFMRQHIIEMNWRLRPIRDPKILKGHDDHVITCLQFCGNRIVSGSDDNTLKVWSAISGKCLRTLVGHTGGVWSSQMSGNIIISGSTDRTLKVWNVETGQCTHTLYGHTSTVRCMHLNGNNVVSGSRDATLRVWDIINGKCLHILVGHLAAVRCVQYDGKLVVSGAYDYMVKVWNPETQECLHTLQGHTNRVYSLQFDGIHVVSGSLDTSIRVWDAETGSCKHTLMGHQSLTSGMELRQNILVSGNADSTVKVWDITNGQCLQTLSGPNKHQSAVTCLQFNSRFVITSSDDGTVKLWDVRTGEFIRNLVALNSGGSGGVVWRIRANDTKLICAVGSRNGTEETKLMVLDFDVEGACMKCS